MGDRVDFVVTLGRVADTANSSGRLERQTRLGTVAIREYQDARCEQVAEALALTLDLALDPRAPEPSAAPPAAAAPAPPPLAESGSTTRAHTSAPTSAWQLGAQGLLETGVAPQPAFGGAASAALDDPDGLVRQLRASLFVVHGRGQARDRELTVTLFGARLEACPLAWELPGVAFYPCAGVDLGALQAAGADALGTSDTGFWAAALAQGRGVFQLGSSLALEAQIGGILPLVKYEMGSAQGGEAWFRTRSLGLQAGLGVVWRGP
ncbi:MAG TPA: hypothetical protein VFS67_25130 [Polyangiaceae bacterium]|nr:hypothetical protein [Polyangiaceae bacterium]